LVKTVHDLVDALHFVVSGIDLYQFTWEKDIPPGCQES
jgi:hypothetical protein